MCIKNYRVYGWKTQMKIQIEDRFIYIMNNVSVRRILIRYSIYKRITQRPVCNFVINGKVTSLPKVIKYMWKEVKFFPRFQRKTYAECYFNWVNWMITCDKQLNENTENTRSSIKTPYKGQDIHIHCQ